MTTCIATGVGINMFLVVVLAVNTFDIPIGGDYIKSEVGIMVV